MLTSAEYTLSSFPALLSTRVLMTIKEALSVALKKQTNKNHSINGYKSCPVVEDKLDLSLHQFNRIRSLTDFFQNTARFFWEIRKTISSWYPFSSTQFYALCQTSLVLAFSVGEYSKKKKKATCRVIQKLLPLLKSYGLHFERRRAGRGGSFDLRSVSALRVHDHT